MKYFGGCKNIKELKKEYKRLAFENHPDRGGDTETMKSINAEYEKALEILKVAGCNEDKQNTEVAGDFIDIINKIINLEGITIDIMGDWIWVKGNTYPHRETLKANGFYFASKKKAWYYKPVGYVKKGNREYSYSEIESMFGKVEVKGAGKKTNFKPQLT